MFYYSSLRVVKDSPWVYAGRRCPASLISVPGHPTGKPGKFGPQFEPRYTEPTIRNRHSDENISCYNHLKRYQVPFNWKYICERLYFYEPLRGNYLHVQSAKTTDLRSGEEADEKETMFIVSRLPKTPSRNHRQRSSSTRSLLYVRAARACPRIN